MLHPRIINLLKEVMNIWKTYVTVADKTAEIKIRQGIFQWHEQSHSVEQLT